MPADPAAENQKDKAPPSMKLKIWTWECRRETLQGLVDRGVISEVALPLFINWSR